MPLVREESCWPPGVAFGRPSTLSIGQVISLILLPMGDSWNSLFTLLRGEGVILGSIERKLPSCCKGTSSVLWALTVRCLTGLLYASIFCFWAILTLRRYSKKGVYLRQAAFFEVTSVSSVTSLCSPKTAITSSSTSRLYSLASSFKFSRSNLRSRARLPWM